MSTGRQILLVDDDISLRESLAEQLELHEEFGTAEAGDAATALDAVPRGLQDATERPR